MLIQSKYIVFFALALGAITWSGEKKAHDPYGDLMLRKQMHFGWFLSLVQFPFQGKVLSSGVPVESEVRFKAENQGFGAISGAYQIQEDSTMVLGSLDSCKIELRERTIDCIWLDKYGEGNAHFEFDGAGGFFSGWWTTEKAPDKKFYWTGVADVNSPMR
jgi:hypothetical protein